MSQSDSRTHLAQQAERRLSDLRRDYPLAIVQIDSVRADDTAIAVKATIGLPGGGRHTSIQALDVDPGRSWADQHSDVQAQALMRALDGLGMVDDQSQPQPQPQPQQATPQTQEARPPQIQPQEAMHPPVATPPTPGANAVQRVDGEHLSEYSWTSFWQAARARNITRDQVERALGRPVQQATPKDAVDALQAAGMWG